MLGWEVVKGKEHFFIFFQALARVLLRKQQFQIGCNQSPARTAAWDNSTSGAGRFSWSHGVGPTLIFYYRSERLPRAKWDNPDLFSSASLRMNRHPALPIGLKKALLRTAITLPLLANDSIQLLRAFTSFLTGLPPGYCVDVEIQTHFQGHHWSAGLEFDEPAPPESGSARLLFTTGQPDCMNNGIDGFRLRLQKELGLSVRKTRFWHSGYRKRSSLNKMPPNTSDCWPSFKLHLAATKPFKRDRSGRRRA
jgi:hypothetical protein